MSRGWRFWRPEKAPPTGQINHDSRQDTLDSQEAGLRAVEQSIDAAARAHAEALARLEALKAQFQLIRRRHQ